VERSDDRVADPALVEVHTQLLVLDRTRNEDRLAFGRDPRPHALGRIQVDRAKRLSLHAGAERGPEGPAPFHGREPRDLGVVGAQHLARLFEDGVDHGVRFERLLEDACGLVEELEALPLVPLRVVTAIGEEQQDRRDEKEPCGQRVDPQDADGGERDACVRQGDDPPRADEAL
jgi:hypothetical protein